MNARVKPTPIDRIFERLAATYGAAWDRSLGQAPIADVMTAWQHELSGFLQNRNAMLAIAWALENLPERCPNVIEFRTLCRRAPAAVLPTLPEPAANPERVAQELAKLAATVKPKLQCNVGNKDWAKRIIDRAKRGDKVNRMPLMMARSALGIAEAA